MKKNIKNIHTTDLQELNCFIGRVQNELKKFCHVSDFIPQSFKNELEKFSYAIDKEFERRENEQEII